MKNLKKNIENLLTHWSQVGEMFLTNMESV